ncbi:hypothetical protein ACFSTC_34885 [Nonomuraea ferruginea]
MSERTEGPSVLDDILDGVRADLAARQQTVSLGELKQRAERAPAPATRSPRWAATGSR